MYYKVEFEILDFDFWAGARDKIDNATDEQIEQVAQRIADVFCDDNHIPTNLEINDFVWFECDDIFNGGGDENDD